jgi:hypothetical protein
VVEEDIGCPQEAGIVSAIAGGQWPTAVEPELREHAASCAICREVADMAAMLRGDQIALCRRADLPSSGQVWWRAAVRARVEAQRAAARPIIMIQRVAAVGAAAAMVAAPMWVAARTDWKAFATIAGASGTEIAAGLGGNATLSVVLAFTACALFAPVVLYLLLSDD